MSIARNPRQRRSSGLGKRIFANKLGALDDNDPFRKTKILDLPQPLRVKIWRLLGFGFTRTLRLICWTIKKDVDQVAGISSAIDSTFKDFPFHCATAIRKVAIHELIKPSYVEFLRYPLILEEVEIRGEISPNNFNYIIKSCPNITTLQIIFNKFVIDNNTAMFPLPPDYRNIQPLSKLHSVKLIATTKKLSELNYVYKNVMGLLKDSLLENNRFKSLHVLISHRISNNLMKEMTATTLRFMHAHLTTLEHINLTFKDGTLTAGAAAAASHAENVKSILPPRPSVDSLSIKRQSTVDAKTGGAPKTGTGPDGKPYDKAAKRKTLPRTDGSADAGSNNSSQLKSHLRKSAGTIQRSSLTPSDARSPKKDARHKHHVHIMTPKEVMKDVHTFDPSAVAATAAEEDDVPASILPADTEGEAEVSPPTKLDQKAAEEEKTDIVSIALKELTSKPWPACSNLRQLYLAVPMRVLEKLSTMLSPDSKVSVINLEGFGGNHQNWPLYVDFIKHTNSFHLEYATFHHINYTNAKGKSRNIDLSIFKKFRALKKLTLLCDVKDDFSALPRASNLPTLPLTIQEVKFERLLLTDWQAYRLFCCFPDLKSVTLEYWSISDRQFAFFMRMLSYLVKWDCTNVQKIDLVETKIRFRNERNAVRRFQDAVKVNASYADQADTRLFIDTKQERDENAFAPSVDGESKAKKEAKAKKEVKAKVNKNEEKAKPAPPPPVKSEPPPNVKNDKKS